MSDQLDKLAAIRNLPAEIKCDLPTLIVNRDCDAKGAFMRTENIVGHVEPYECYQLCWNGMIAKDGINLADLPTPIEPDHVVLDGEWTSEIDFVAEDANILGGNGRYTLANGQRELIIPEAACTPEHLAFYGSRLVKVGDPLLFQADAPLPVTQVSVGKNYATDYLMNSSGGGGEFLEMHDRPHFHMPLDPSSAGYLFIGTDFSNSQRKVSAFQIPFGYGVLMPPWVIHADSHLIGRFLVVYSVTSVFSTVTIRNSDGELAPIVVS